MSGIFKELKTIILHFVRVKLFCLAFTPLTDTIQWFVFGKIFLVLRINYATLFYSVDISGFEAQKWLSTTSN